MEGPRQLGQEVLRDLLSLQGVSNPRQDGEAIAPLQLLAEVIVVDRSQLSRIGKVVDRLRLIKIQKGCYLAVRKIEIDEDRSRFAAGERGEAQADRGGSICPR